MQGLLPVLAYHFHLSPSDVWDLNHDELGEFLKALDEIEKANKT